MSIDKTLKIIKTTFQVNILMLKLKEFIYKKCYALTLISFLPLL